jgi:hypothetical protein
LVTSDQDKQLEIYLGILKTIAAESKKRGEDLVVGFIKADDQWFVGTYNNEKIMASIKGMGINLIDMTLAEKNELLTKNYYIHELDKHPTGAANLARAKLLMSNVAK